MPTADSHLRHHHQFVLLLMDALHIHQSPSKSGIKPLASRGPDFRVLATSSCCVVCLNDLRRKERCCDLLEVRLDV